MDITNISTDLIPTESEELIESFRNLVLSCSASGDVETLELFNTILSEELERLSSTSSTYDPTEVFPNLDEFVPIISDIPRTPPPDIEITPEIGSNNNNNMNTQNMSKLVDLDTSFVSSHEFTETKSDLNSLFSGCDKNSKYIWLSDKSSIYRFGHQTLISKDIRGYQGIFDIMELLNSKSSDLSHDSCLITRYRNSTDVLTLHQDNEELLDPTHPISNISIGSDREIQFWDSNNEKTGNLTVHLYLTEGSLLTMKAGCQIKLWHKVLEGVGGGTRYCLSFRKLDMSEDPTTPELVSSLKKASPITKHSTPFFSVPSQSGASLSNTVSPISAPATHGDPSPFATPSTTDPSPTATSTTPIFPPPSDHPLLPDTSGFVPFTPPSFRNYSMSTHHTPPLVSASHPPPPRGIPLPPLQELQNGFPVHPGRVSTVIPTNPPTTPTSSLSHAAISTAPPLPSPSATSTTPASSPPPASSLPPSPPRGIPLPPLQELQNGFPVHPGRVDGQTRKSIENVIIGDSLVKGLDVPNTLHLCKGGIHPKEVLTHIIPIPKDVLPPESYSHVKTLTLIVGTNALNVDSYEPTPLLDVIKNYENLVRELRSMFPNAQIALFNVIPRMYTTKETLHRIEIFNTFVSAHIAHLIPNVHWIEQYWEFIDNFGYLRSDLYGKHGVHLKKKGKNLMSEAIQRFQRKFK